MALDHRLAPFLNWIEAQAEFAPLVVFLLAFAESLPLIGLFVPGSALLLGVAVLIALDAVPGWPVVLAAMLGAALGDSTGYVLARRLGPGFFRRHVPARWRRLYAWSLLAFRRWGWWAVFLSRFFAPLRAFVPVVAGLSYMSMARFQAANIPSALIWAPLILLPGKVASWANRALGPEALLLFAALLAALMIWAWQGQRRRARNASRKRGKPRPYDAFGWFSGRKASTRVRSYEDR